MHGGITKKVVFSDRLLPALKLPVHILCLILCLSASVCPKLRWGFHTTCRMRRCASQHEHLLACKAYVHVDIFAHLTCISLHEAQEHEAEQALKTIYGSLAVRDDHCAHKYCRSDSLFWGGGDLISASSDRKVILKELIVRMCV